MASCLFPDGHAFRCTTQFFYFLDPAYPMPFKASSISPRIAGSSMVAGTLYSLLSAIF
jgi:hypothetical protein